MKAAIKKIGNVLSVLNNNLGHTRVPSKFKIPFTKDWPMELHGLRAGAQLCKLRMQYRQGKLSALEIEMLEKKHMVWDIDEYDFNLYVESLARFRKLYKHMLVPIKYTVAVGDAEWPEEYWGLKLGGAVNRFRLNKQSGRLSQHKVDRLDAVHFVWDVQACLMNEMYLPALKWFKCTFGHVKVPAGYVVPNDDCIPEKIRKIKLRNWVDRIHCGQNISEHQVKQLKEIGYDLEKLRMQNRYDKFVQDLHGFYDEHGHLEIPSSYKSKDGALGQAFYKFVLHETYYDYYESKQMESLGLYRTITDAMYDHVVLPELEQFQLENTKINANSAGKTIHLGYLKNHCQHPKLTAYLKLHNL